MQLELSIALKMVYGEILNTTGDRRCGPAVEHRQILLLPRGDCTDPPSPAPPAPPPAPDDQPAP
jgi:hypothetical protein